MNQTIDAALGQALPAVFPQLVLGIVKDANLSMVYNCSGSGVNKPIPTICHPELAYSTVFGSVAEGSARQQFNSDRNLLDFMLDDKGRDADEVLDIIRAYHAELVMRLIKKLQAVPEGNGTMMDNTLIFFTSDAGNTHHPDFDQWPLLVIGDLGGRLKTGGRFLG